jgi:hypothetical protein
MYMVLRPIFQDLRAVLDIILRGRWTAHTFMLRGHDNIVFEIIGLE